MDLEKTIIKGLLLGHTLLIWIVFFLYSNQHNKIKEELCQSFIKSMLVI